jgi:excisionase family DNA binding protein
MTIARDQLLTSYEAGALLQMDPNSVVKWVSEGKLQAYLTPGGHRRIRADELLAFLKRYSMYIPAEFGDLRTNVLVVDDDENLLKALGRSMKSHDKVAVNTCSSGIEALVRIGAERPDVLVMDVHMPDVDGFDVLRALKANAATKGMQVVMMTGKPSAELEKKALGMGAKAMVAKPMKAADLAQILGVAAP